MYTYIDTYTQNYADFHILYIYAFFSLPHPLSCVQTHAYTYKHTIPINLLSVIYKRFVYESGSISS